MIKKEIIQDLQSFPLFINNHNTHSKIIKILINNFIKNLDEDIYPEYDRLILIHNHFWIYLQDNYFKLNQITLTIKSLDFFNIKVQSFFKKTSNSGSTDYKIEYKDSIYDKKTFEKVLLDDLKKIYETNLIKNDPFSLSNIIKFIKNINHKKVVTQKDFRLEFLDKRIDPNYKLFIWDKDYDSISIEEVTSSYHFSKSNLLIIGNRGTDKFIEVTSHNELKFEIYDIASRFFENWETEILYDSLFSFDEPLGTISKAEIKGIDFL